MRGSGEERDTERLGIVGVGEGDGVGEGEGGYKGGKWQDGEKENLGS